MMTILESDLGGMVYYRIGKRFRKAVNLALAYKPLELISGMKFYSVSYDFLTIRLQGLFRETKFNKK